MDNLQAIQIKMSQEIQDLDGGWKTVAAEMGCTDRFLQKTLNPKDSPSPRLVTLERIKKGIKTCQQKENERKSALLS